MYSATLRICSARLLPTDDSPNGCTGAFRLAAPVVYPRIVHGPCWHALCMVATSQKRRIPMLEQGRYPTHEEIEVIIARARRMRAQFIAAMFAGALRRVKETLSGARTRARTKRGAGARRFRPDMG
jgi:hypothetical protein